MITRSRREAHITENIFWAYGMERPEAKREAICRGLPL